MTIQEGSIRTSGNVQCRYSDNMREIPPRSKGPFLSQGPILFLPMTMSGIVKPRRCRCRIQVQYLRQTGQRTPSRMMLCTVFYI